MSMCLCLAAHMSAGGPTDLASTTNLEPDLVCRLITLSILLTCGASLSQVLEYLCPSSLSSQASVEAQEGPLIEADRDTRALDCPLQAYQ